MTWRLLIVAVVAGATLLGLSSVFAAPPGGDTLETAVELGGTKTGILAAGNQSWYKFWDGGTTHPLGVVLRFEPFPSESNPLVTFNVYIVERKNMFELQNVMIAQATDSGLPAGLKYWRGGSNVERTYYLQVVNDNTEGSVRYALAFTGEAFPPPTPVLGALAPAAPAPPVSATFPETTYILGETRQIGAYTIRLWKGTGPMSIVSNNIITIAAPGQPIEQVEMVFQLDELTGQDITGDGNPDLIFETFSGGAHCCFSTFIYDLGPTLTKLLESQPSNCGGNFQDLDGDGVYEFLTCDDLFAYKYCPYAWSPLVQAVLKYQPGSGYLAAGSRYPGLYAEDIARHTKTAQEGAPGDAAEWDDTNKCAVLPLVLDHLYSGQPEAALAALRQYYQFPDWRDWWAEVREAVSQSPLFGGQ